LSAVAAAFERLGIAPTRDVKTIKRAYAVALKAIDQASEREAFEQLRQAYEQVLARAARVGDVDEDWDGEDEQDDDQDDQGASDTSEGDVPIAPSGDPRRPVVPPLLPVQPHMVPATPTLDDAHQALHDWIDRLRDAAAGAATAVLEAALADPRLLHLDSHAQLEAQVADLLHGDPAGRIVLFDTAAQRFHWIDRNARPIASAAAAHWISRVVNQDLQWRAQALAERALQQQALQTVTRMATPQPEELRRFASAIESMASDFPDWFALHLEPSGHANLPAWQAAHAKLAPLWARKAERQQRCIGVLRKAMNLLVGGFLLQLLAAAMPPAWQTKLAPLWARDAERKQRRVSALRRAMNLLVGLFVLLGIAIALSGVTDRLRGIHAPSAAANSSKPGIGTPSTAPEPVLAYEFTGAVTHDSCEGAEEFVHESNWLQVGDGDAVALLATRAMRCQDKGLWLRKDDTLMACLRAERAAALGASRAEDARQCLRLEPASRR